MENPVDVVVRKMPPGAFAFVMATGIVSSGCYLIRWWLPSRIMFVVALLGALLLVVALIWRLLKHGGVVLNDAGDPEVCFGFFTIVAAANVLGVRFDLDGWHRSALVLGAVSVLLWLLLTYALPSVLLLGQRRVPLLTTVNGSWFLWVVGTQSLATAAASAGLAYRSNILAATAVALWGLGVALYLLITTLVVLRLMSATIEPESFGPAYWIAMGATAITVLAGSQIVRLPEDAPVMVASRHFISGTSYLFWAVGLWWIPLLVIFGIWRHLVRGHPFRYENQVWSIVFPLGMYGSASVLYGESEQLPFMHDIGNVTIVIGCLVWLIAAIQMMLAAARFLARPPQTSPTRH